MVEPALDILTRVDLAHPPIQVVLQCATMAKIPKLLKLLGVIDPAHGPDNNLISTNLSSVNTMKNYTIVFILTGQHCSVSLILI